MSDASNTSDWVIRENRSTIAALKQEGQELLRQLQEQQPKRAVVKLEHSVQTVRSSIDRIVQQKRQCAASLEQVVSDLYSLPKDTNPSKETLAALKTIRGLENRLDKAFHKHNEAHSIRRTYQQAAVSLEQERRKLQQQLQQLHDGTQQHAHNLEKAQLESREVSHAKDEAKALVQDAERTLAQQRGARERLLQQKRDICLQGPALLDQHPGDAAASQHPYSGDRSVDRMCRKLLVQSPADLPFKISAQQQTRRELQAAMEAAEQAVQQLASEKAALQGRLAELHSGGAQRTQAVIDKLKEQQQAAAAELEQNQCAMEEAVQGLVQVQAGVHHLSGMVAGLQDVPLALTGSNTSLLEALARIHKALQAARTVIQQYPAAEARLHSLVQSAADYS